MIKTLEKDKIFKLSCKESKSNYFKAIARFNPFIYIILLKIYTG